MIPLVTKARTWARMLTGKTTVDPDNDTVLAELLTDLADEVERLLVENIKAQARHKRTVACRNAYSKRTRRLEQRLDRRDSDD